MDLGMDGWVWSTGWSKSQQMTSVTQEAWIMGFTKHGVTNQAVRHIRIKASPD